MKTVKYLAKCAILVVILIVLYVGFLSCSYYISKESMRENLENAYDQIDTEGIYYFPLGINALFFDNATDSTIVNTCATQTNDGVITQAVNNAYTVREDSIDEWYREQPLDGIKLALENSGAIQSYSRYWAGITGILRVWFKFSTLGSFRVLILGIEVILFALCLHFVFRYLGRYGVIAFILMSFWRCPMILMGMCLAYSSDIVLMLVNTIVLGIYLENSSKKMGYVLLLLGSFQCFINYFSFPLISIMIPIVFLITVRVKQQMLLKETVRESIFIALNWITGYVTTLLGKQVISKVVLGEQTGTSQILYRMGDGNSLRQRFEIAMEAWLGRGNGYLYTIRIIGILFLVFVILFNRKKLQIRQNQWLLLIASLIPAAWHFVMSGHSGHGFTSVISCISAYAVMNAIIMLVKEDCLDVKAKSDWS